MEQPVSAEPDRTVPYTDEHEATPVPIQAGVACCKRSGM